MHLCRLVTKCRINRFNSETYENITMCRNHKMKRFNNGEIQAVNSPDPVTPYEPVGCKVYP